MAQPEPVAVVGDNQVEAAVGSRVEIRQCFGGARRIGVVERLQHQFAARTQTGGGTERAVPVQDRGRHTPIVDAEPRAAGEQVEPGDDFGAVGPVPARRLGRAVDHLVAVGADDDRPLMLRPTQDHQRAHSVLIRGSSHQGISTAAIRL